MSARTHTLRAPAEPRVALLLAMLGGMGCVLAAAGAAMRADTLALAGGACVIAALVALVATAWLDGLLMVALAVPLPALYETDALRIASAAVLTAVMLAGWTLARAVADRPAGTAALPRRAAFALFAAVALAALFADVPAAAVRELVNFALLLGLLVAATDLLAAKRHRIHSVALALASAAGVAGVLAVLQAGGVLPGRFPLAGTSFQRASLGFGWPNELGVFFALSVPFCWYARTVGRGAARALGTVALAAAGLGLLATFSRGAWLACLLSTGVLVLSGGARLGVRLAFGAIAAAVLADLAAGGVVLDRMLSLTDDPYVVQRAALMLVGVVMFAANPLVGVGPGGFRENLEHYGPQVPWLWDYVGSAHNAYLEIAAETGLLGLAALVWFLGAVFVVLLRGARRPADAATPLRRALLWAYTAACLAAFTVWPFAHGIGQLVMLVIAMGVVAARPAATEARGAP